MKKKVSRISIFRSSLIVTVLYILLGLIYSMIGIPMLIFGDERLQVMGVVYLWMPLIMAMIGFIGFVIVAGLYNLLARFLGGIEFELTDVE